MPPSDNMPDFDSMSPEEIQAWMETLAERQGATEGFTTDTRMDIQEIDPTTVQVEDNYIPYGKTADEWARIQEEERAARQATRPVQPSAPQPTPAVASVTSTPDAAPNAAPDAMPDFDSMTPEEIQIWMESLAERQGATEGFTTEARVDIAEIDPTTVEIEDKYIPYGKTADEWAIIQEEERAARQAAKPPQATPQSPAPPPVLESFADAPAPESQSMEMDWLSELAAPINEEAVPDAMPELDLSGLGDDLPDIGDLDLGDLDMQFDFDSPLDLDLDALDLEGLSGLGESGGDPMAWLDGLVAEQDTPFDLPTDDVVPQAVRPSARLDLPPLDEEESGGTDTLDWLNNLAQPDAGFNLPDLPEPEPLPFDGGDEQEDPAAWLDALAGGGEYNPRDMADEPTRDIFDDEDVNEAETVEGVSTDALMQDLSKGISDPGVMKAWMDQMLEAGASRTDVADYDFDDEDELTLEPASADWLAEIAAQAQAQSQTDTVPAVSEEQLIADLGLDSTFDTGDWDADSEFGVEAEGDIDFDSRADDALMGEMPDWLMQDDADGDDAPLEPQIPDWLMEDLPEGTDEVQAIFAKPDLIDDDSDLDNTDSWVEAFELEREMRRQGLDDIPEEWLEGELPQVDTSAIRESVLTGQIVLQQTSFADDELPVGQLETIPAWLDTSAEPQIIEVEAPPPVVVEPVAAVRNEDDDLPDWLRMEGEEADELDAESIPDWLAAGGVEDVEQVPDWLLDTGMLSSLPPEVEARYEQAISESEALQSASTQPAPKPATPAPKPSSSPAPVYVGDVDAQAVLNSARAKMKMGAVEDSLQDYETVIRVNQNLGAVVEDLKTLVKEGPQKRNAAAHRVLGDGLMRQGRLQEALDTYRKALNLL